MDDNPRLYCKVFVDADESPGAVQGILGTIASASRSAMSIDVRRNDDFDRDRRLTNDGFLFFRYYLDVDPASGVPRTSYIVAVAELLEALWRNGCRAVAACDFEDELPRRGGYNPRLPRA